MTTVVNIETAQRYHAEHGQHFFKMTVKPLESTHSDLYQTILIDQKERVSNGSIPVYTGCLHHTEVTF